MAKENDKKSDEEKAKKKGTVTPKRKEQEQKNLRPIVAGAKSKVKLSKEEKAELKAARNQATSESITKEREAMRTGDQKFLPERDKGPIKKFIRHKVDEKRTVVEFFLFVAIVMLIGSSALSAVSYEFAFYLTIATYIYLIASIIIIVVKVRRIKSEAVAEFGFDKVKASGGNTMYIIARMSQPRFLRLPKVGV